MVYIHWSRCRDPRLATSFGTTLRRRNDSLRMTAALLVVARASSIDPGLSLGRASLCFVRHGRSIPGDRHCPRLDKLREGVNGLACLYLFLLSALQLTFSSYSCITSPAMMFLSLIKFV